jgi:hypothetical protein
MTEARPILFVVYRPRRSALLVCVGILIAALALFSRAPGHLTAPELWAEDGKLWLWQAFYYGPRCLLWPKAGYLQTFSWLVALLALKLPFTLIPLFFALIAFVVQLAPAALLLSARGAALLPSLTARLLLVGYYIGQPNSGEVYVNLTNAMWHLALLAFLLTILPKPRTEAGVAIDIIVLILAGLSGPLVLFIAPIAWWHVWDQRRAPAPRPRLLYAAVLSGCALIQGAVIASQAVTHRVSSAHLGATLNRLVHILANQIALGGIIGGFNVTNLMQQPWWLHGWPAGLLCVFVGALGLAAFIRGPTAYRQFAVLSALVLVSALKSPMITKVMPQWDPMQMPGTGDRYYILPMLAWFATLLVLAARPWAFAGHWLARALLCASLIGIVADWTYLPYVPTGYHAAAKTFDAAPPGTTVTFPENPPPWSFTLTKR